MGVMCSRLLFPVKSKQPGFGQTAGKTGLVNASIEYITVVPNGKSKFKITVHNSAKVCVCGSHIWLQGTQA